MFSGFRSFSCLLLNEAAAAVSDVLSEGRGHILATNPWYDIFFFNIRKKKNPKKVDGKSKVGFWTLNMPKSAAGVY